MRIAGMMRLAEIDQTKVGKDLMMYSIEWMASKCDVIYFLKIGKIDTDVMDFIQQLPQEVHFTNQSVDYSTGWMFQNNESLDDLYKSIPNEYDWVIYPDADDLLPENLLELIEEADAVGADVIRFHFIETFGDKEKIIQIKPGFPIGPHFKAIRMNEDVTFRGGDGFNEPTTNSGRVLKRYETEYCMRHLRYAYPNGIEERKRMNYFQEYFLQDHKLIDYKPNQKRRYYEES
jgi:hypothetical protein